MTPDLQTAAVLLGLAAVVYQLGCLFSGLSTKDDRE